MDTRRKLLTLDAALALAPGTLTLAAGTFDALRAAHAGDLAALERPLLVAVLPLPGELVPQSARAEMVAGLRVVDYVVIADESELEPLVERLAPRSFVRLEALHGERVRELIEHVRSRQTR